MPTKVAKPSSACGNHEVLTAERFALIGLRDNGTISDEVLHQLEQELDVAALHQGVGERRVGRRKTLEGRESVRLVSEPPPLEPAPPLS